MKLKRWENVSFVVEIIIRLLTFFIQRLQTLFFVTFYVFERFLF